MVNTVGEIVQDRTTLEAPHGRPEAPAVRASPSDMDAAVQRGLSADIHLLGDLLGAAVRRLAGEEAFTLEEEIRAAAKELRAHPSLDEARRLRINISETLERRLRSIVRAEQEKRWLEENREAIASINSFIDRHGLLAGKLRYRPDSQ